MPDREAEARGRGLAYGEALQAEYLRSLQRAPHKATALIARAQRRQVEEDQPQPERPAGEHNPAAAGWGWAGEARAMPGADVGGCHEEEKGAQGACQAGEERAPRRARSSFLYPIKLIHHKNGLSGLARPLQTAEDEYRFTCSRGYRAYRWFSGWHCSNLLCRLSRLFAW